MTDKTAFEACPIERKHQIFEEWALMTPCLPIARDGDGEYENDATNAYWKCFEFGFNRGVMLGIFADAATKINGDLCDKVATLESALTITPEDVERCARAMEPMSFMVFDQVESGEYKAAPGYQDILKTVDKCRKHAQAVLTEFVKGKM